MKMLLHVRHRCHATARHEGQLVQNKTTSVPDNEDDVHLSSSVQRLVGLRYNRRPQTTQSINLFEFSVVGFTAALLISWVTLSALFFDFTVGKLFSTQMSQRVVVTRHGRLRGILITLPDPELPPVEAYFGLEYASLLGGELRFMPPTTPTTTSWDGVRTALKFKPVCPQPVPDVDALAAAGSTPPEVVEHLRRIVPFLERQQEDCLFLNVYVPTNRGDRNSSELLPVVVFVHGESYDIGTGNAYDGSVMAAFGRIIVVTFNYRLGILGFLTTADGHAPGNYALLDQVAALHWIADNIEAFGGNPSAVTLLGDRVGGAMVGLLTMSPIARGRNLFQRVIIHSGSILSSWAVSDDAVHYTWVVAEMLNCTSPGADLVEAADAVSSSSRQQHQQQSVPGSPDNANVVQCLRRYSADSLANVNVAAGGSGVRPVAVPWFSATFGPTLDGAGIRNVATETPVTATSMIDELCGHRGGESVETVSNGVRYIDHSTTVFGKVPVLLGVLGNEGYAYVDHRRPTTRKDGGGDDDDDGSERDEEDAVDQMRWRRGLRTYVRSNCHYHQQKILDVLAHNYNDWENEYRPQPSYQQKSDHPTREKLTSQPQPTAGQSATGSSFRSPLSSGHRPISPRRRVDDLAELIGDGQYVAPIVRLARVHATCGTSTGDDPNAILPGNREAVDGGPITYMYAYDGKQPADDETTATNDDDSAAAGAHRVPGGGYKRDLAYAFGAPLADGIDPFATSNRAYTEADRELAKTVLTYWTNFIRTGNPNRDPSGRTPSSYAQWTQFEPENQAYLSIGIPNAVHYHYKSHKMALWNDLIPRLHRPDEIDLQLHQLDYEDDDDVIVSPYVRTHRRMTPTGNATNRITPTLFAPSTTMLHTPDSNRRPSNILTDVPSPKQRRPTPATTRPITGSGFVHQVTTPMHALVDGKSPVTQTAEKDATVAVSELGLVASVTERHPGLLSVLSGRSTLGLTAIVGCALLTLNIIVFAATFCQWRKLVRRGRKCAMSAIAMQDGGGVVGSDEKYLREVSDFLDAHDQRERKLYVTSVTSPSENCTADRRAQGERTDLCNGGSDIRSSYASGTISERGNHFVRVMDVEYGSEDLLQLSMPLPSPSTTPTNRKYHSPASNPQPDGKDHVTEHEPLNHRTLPMTAGCVRSLIKRNPEMNPSDITVPLVEMPNGNAKIGSTLKAVDHDVMQRRSSTIV